MDIETNIQVQHTLVMSGRELGTLRDMLSHWEKHKALLPDSVMTNEEDDILYNIDQATKRSR